MAAVGYDLDEIRQALGLVSIPAARDRVKVMRSVLEQKGWLRRGRNNELLVTAEGLQVLKRLEEIHQTGVPLREAVKRVMEELGIARDEVAALKAKVEELRRRLNGLEPRLAELEEICDRVRSSWVFRLFGGRLPRLPDKTASDKPPHTEGT